MFRKDRAKFAATVDFPTPPLPLDTATICLIPAKVEGPWVVGACAVPCADSELWSNNIFMSLKDVSFFRRDFISDTTVFFFSSFWLFNLSKYCHYLKISRII